MPIVVGVVIALVRAPLKAAARPVVNATTAGIGAPVASTAEDATSVVMSFIAIIFPLLIIVLFFLLIWFFIAMFAPTTTASRRQPPPLPPCTAGRTHPRSRALGLLCHRSLFAWIKELVA